MKKDPSQMTNEERWGRVGELLYKGDGSFFILMSLH